MDRSSRPLPRRALLTRGEAIQATNAFLTIPGTLTQQASWEFDLAMCDLEAGMPTDAASTSPRHSPWHPICAVRPIAAYYLQKIGKPVPDSTKSDQVPAKPTAPLAANPTAPLAANPTAPPAASPGKPGAVPTPAKDTVTPPAHDRDGSRHRRNNHRLPAETAKTAAPGPASPKGTAPK